VANIGTTVRGAIDNVEKIVNILKDNAISEFYIHCDAALGGMILPFIQEAPVFDFRLPIGSIAISGHKVIGSPIPCGIALTRKKYVQRIERSIEYIGTFDTTLSGSRNGFSVLLLWYAIKKFGQDGFKKMVKQIEEISEYTLKKLHETGWDAWKNKYSNIIVIKRPPDTIVKKWCLAVEKDISHIVVMSHVTKQMVDRFINDISKFAADRRKK
jgi:histidine decarboxylase